MKKVKEVDDSIIIAKRALVGAGARILFYPTLLYNVVRYKIGPQFRWWDQIHQFVVLGAVPFKKDIPKLKKLGVAAVVTLNEPYETLVPTSLYHAHGIAHLVIATRDYLFAPSFVDINRAIHGIDHLVIPTRDYLFAPSFVDINRAVDFIHKNASSGRTTYVHCKAGRGRSTTIVLCYLVEYMHMSPDAALEYIRCRRPRVLLTRSQRKAVQEYMQQRMAAKEACSSGDTVLITSANVEIP